MEILTIPMTSADMDNLSASPEVDGRRSTFTGLQNKNMANPEGLQGEEP